MRAHPKNFDVAVARDLNQALGLLAQREKSWRPLAGGTDLMVLYEKGVLPSGNYLDVWGLKELKAIDVDEHSVVIGALATFKAIGDHPVIKKEFPMLASAAKLTGAVAIQNRATLGGNIANASPAADSSPALLAYEAQLELTCLNGVRWIPYSEFHTGYKKHQLRADELITRVKLKRQFAKGVHFYKKVGTRAYQSISKLCFAAYYENTGQKSPIIYIAMGAVAPTPIRLYKTERALASGDEKKAYEVITRELAPIDDIRSNKRYRLQVSLNVLVQFVEQIKESEQA